MITLTYNDKILTLTQEAFINRYIGQTNTGWHIDDDYYQAHAIDQDNSEYTVLWDIINPDCDDESNACDWDNPAYIIAQ